MTAAEAILAEVEARADGHDDGHLYSIGAAPYIAWDGEFEYYADQAGQQPITRKEALDLLTAQL